MLLASAAAGLIAGAGPSAFFAAAVSAALATWLARVPQSATQYLFATLDPLDPDGAIILRATREALDLIGRTRHPVLLRIAAFTRGTAPRFQLDLNREGDLEVIQDRRSPALLKRPMAWVPDHPLPLTLPHTRCLTLRFTPTDRERVRVKLAHEHAFSRGLWVAVAMLAAAACVSDVGWLLATALGFAFQAYLLEHHPHRSHNQA